MKRSIITFIVFLAVQCGLSQGTGYWDLPSKSINGLNYFLFEETGEVMVADENCWEGELVLPTVVNWDGHDYPVKYLASRAFANCKSLTRVIIPENIQDILFYVSYLGNRDIIKSPFHGCSQLESIEVAENNRWLCSVDGVLYKHDRTQLFNYPSGASRTHFAIPEGVEAIGTAAFRGSANLTSVSIPNTVTQIFEEAFYDCDNIKQIDIPDNISTIKTSTFHGCSKLKSIHLPDNLTEIENAAFFGCLSLKEIVFPEKLQTLGGAVFRGCQLETVVIKGYLYDYSIKNLLQDLNKSAKLYVPASEVDRYKSLYSGTVLPLEEYEGRKETQEYFPEGTKWTEIRLDTLKYNSWYSKVGDEWVPNFETIEYRVQGEHTSFGTHYKCVYNNDPDWAGQATFLIYEKDNNEVLVSLLVLDENGNESYTFVPSEIYQFNWSIGQWMWFQTPDETNTTAIFQKRYSYGIIDEIKEGYFGGVSPLKYVDLDGKAPDNPELEPKYVDTNGGRIIQGIGITEWNDGECLLGPINMYKYLDMWGVGRERHYRSMLVHFERDGEVLYDVWPEKEAITKETVTFTKGQIATIILPIAPDASKGRYYRLDRWENKHLVFEEECHPRARTPYIIVPNEDFNMEISASDVNGLRYDTVRIEAVSPLDPEDMARIRFVGTYSTRNIGFYDNGFHYFILNAASDGYLHCVAGPPFVVTAMHAFFEISIRFCYDRETRRYRDKLEYVLHNQEEPIEEPVAYTKDQMATIILPTEPDASKGKYYRLDRVEGNEIVFEQEHQPRAHVPYIIVPGEDFSIDPGTLDLEGCRPDTASISGIRFIGTYCSEELPALSVGTGGGFRYIDIIDTTPDCREDAEASVVGALRAYLEVDPSALNWDDPYHPGGTKSPRKEEEKMPVVLKDSGTSIHGIRDEMANSKLPDSIFYDLSGRRIVNSKSSNGKLSRGVYIKDGKKVMR